MTFSSLLWLSTAAYAVHVIEEHALDWRNWARNVLDLPAEWPDFYVTNAVVGVLGVCAASISTDAPAVALAFPALMLINATFFHVAPFLIKKGRFSPGLITALLLFYPIAWMTYRRAEQLGLLSSVTLTVSLLIGALLMATPILFLRIKSKPYFKQD